MGFTQQDTRQYAAGQTQTGTGTHLGGHHNNMTTTADGTPAVPITQTPATGPAPNTAGPHRHDILNKLDPRVDSDLAGTGVTGGTANAYGSNTHSGNTTGGPLHHNRHQTDATVPVAAGLGAGTGAGLGHNNNYANQGGLGTTGHAHNHGAAHSHGVGAPHTAGPHHSDVLNTLDPTVDSRTGLRK